MGTLRASLVPAIFLFAVLAAPTTQAHTGLAPHTRAALESTGRVHSMVLDGLEETPRVRVFLELDLGAAGASLLEQDVWSLRRPWVRSATGAVVAKLTGQGFEVTHRFEGIGAVAGWIDAAGIQAALASPYVRRVAPDSAGHAALLQSLPLTRLSDTRDAGFSGAGVKVAVIDSGVNKNHPALVGAVVAEACFCSTNCCPNGQDTQIGSGAAFDSYGHGTNVTGIMASSGSGDAPRGAVPAADVVAVRVLDNNGFFSTTADIVAAMEWILDNHPDVAAVNMSLATNSLSASQCDGTFSAFANAADDLRDAGILPVAAAGNNGSTTQMSAPACLSDVVSVGAVWDSNVGTQSVFCQETTAADKITCFSNRNQYTDMLAPGAPVTAPGLGSGVSTYYGTSQASPMVAACAVAMRQADEDVTPAQMIAAMQDSPKQIHDAASGRTFARLDCADAVAEFAPTTTTTTLNEDGLCGDANGDGNVLSSDALAVLQSAVGLPTACPEARCDFDGSGSVTASDSLSTLKRAVGQNIVPGCTAEA